MNVGKDETNQSKEKNDSLRSSDVKIESQVHNRIVKDEKIGLSLHNPPSWGSSIKEEVPSTYTPLPNATYHNFPEIPDELEKIYRKVYAPRKPPTPSKPKYPQTSMPDFPYIFPPQYSKNKLPLPTLKQVQKAIPAKASSVFHVLDRRINFDSFPPDVSLYSLLRAWIKDDPYLAQNPKFDLFQYVSLPSQRRDVISHSTGTRSYPQSHRKRKIVQPSDILSVIKDNNNYLSSQESSYGRCELLAEHISHGINIRKKHRKELNKVCKKIESTAFFKDLLPIKEPNKEYR